MPKMQATLEVRQSTPRELSPLSPMSKSGCCRLTGITEVAEHVAIDTRMDRAYPDYDYPAPLLADPHMANYRAFLD